MVALKELKNMFWGVTIDGGKRYTQTVENTFHISMAALEPTQKTVNDKGEQSRFVSVMLQHEKAEFLLCTLEPGKLLQVPLNLSFTEGEEVTFFLNGKGVVHLTGYLEPDVIGEYETDTDDEEADATYMQGSEEDEDASNDDEDSDDEVDWDEEDDSDDEVPQLLQFGEDGEEEEVSDEEEEEDSDEEETLPAKGKRKREKELSNKKKRMKLEDLPDQSDSDDEDWEDLEGEEALDDEDDEDEEEEAEVSMDHDAEDKENEDIGASFVEKKSKKKKKKNKAKQEAEVEKSPKVEASPAETNGATPSTDKKKKKKKKKKKNKDAAESSEQSPAKTPGSTPAKSPATTPAKTPGSEKKEGGGKKTPAKKMVLSGGVIAEDLKEGHGPNATPGKRVGVYYRGTLSKGGKQFDANQSGAPFQFQLGKSEVIKGWDIGVKGMKVGGKRKLTIPANMAYGNQRVSSIPPNSTLVFEVELKSVK